MFLQAVVVSKDHLLSAKIESGEEVRLIPLSDKNASLYVSSARKPPFAHSVVLLDHREGSQDKQKGDRRNTWLSNYVKELLGEFFFFC